MKAFSDLYSALDETNKTSRKVVALASYFTAAPSGDAAWAVYFLVGRKPRQVVPSRKLALWSAEAGDVPTWLFEESYLAVGDIAETVALLLPAPERCSDRPLKDWVENRLLPLRGLEEAEQRAAVLQAWTELDRPQRFVWNKLITGEFRVGVSQRLVIRALAETSRVDAAVIAHRLMGDWEPTPEFFVEMLAQTPGDADVSRPYPFFLAHPLDGEPSALGERAAWQAEWKWDGIRSQLIRRAGRTFLWSRGEELVTDRYPELADAATRIPDGTVIDGEILPWREERVQPFAELQRRIGRKAVTKKLLQEVPVVIMAYDLLEESGQDIRLLALAERRARLERTVVAAGDSRFRLSPLVDANTWESLAQTRRASRDLRVEGMMLKRLDSPYRVGRQRGDWWKWKIDPFTIDAVLIYAQRGSGKRAGLYTDYTFGVWDEGKLVPIAKAYSGLTDAEIREVDSFVRQHTVEKFGPVRTVQPELVFEIAFEGIQRSSRHKSGVAVRFPRINRWRIDKKAADADSLDALRRLLSNG